MPDVTRTFIAVSIPRALEPRLTHLQREVAQDARGVRMVEALPFHITLAFLGDVANADLVSVCRAMSEAVVAFRPFTIELKGLGCFPNANRPRVLWAGVAGPGVDDLTRLQAAVARATASVDYPAEESKKYHPHVTLGRLKPGRGPVQDLTPVVDRGSRWTCGPITVNEVVAYSSTLTPESPIYAALGRSPLKGKGEIIRR